MNPSYVIPMWTLPDATTHYAMQYAFAGAVRTQREVADTISVAARECARTAGTGFRVMIVDSLTMQRVTVRLKPAAAVPLEMRP